MKKLLKLKEWLTPEEAVYYLSTEIGEKVSVSDLYRFAIDEHLTLSVNFVNQAKVKVGQVVKIHHSELRSIEGNNFTDEELSEPSTLPLDHHIHVADDTWVALSPEVTSIRGVWDLTMLGSELLDVENHYYQQTSGVEVILSCLEGVLIRQGDVVCQLQTNFNDIEYQLGTNTKKIIDDELCKRKEPLYSPSGSLDDYDHILVVRTEEVTRFIHSMKSTAAVDKPLTSRERNNLLKLVSATLKYADIDINDRGVIEAIVKITELNGTAFSDDTIRKYVNQIKDLA